MRRILMMAAVAAVLLTSANARAEDWPSWRGPRGDGTSLEANIPLHWSATENIAWKTPIPGTGHSSPVIAGGKMFLTSCIDGQKERVLLAVDPSDGRILWQKAVLAADLERKNTLNSYASSTPATDGKRVWVTFLDAPNIQVACYDAYGNEVWRKSPGKFASVHGFCSSLIPYKDTIILNADQDAKGDDRAYIVALDQATGAEKWRIDRPNRIRSYCPPTIFQAAGKTQMVLSGCKCVASYDPDTGKQYWIIDGPTEQFVASMVMTDGVFGITGGFPTLHILGIRPDGKGNVSDTHVMWHLKKDANCAPSYVPSPIAAGKYFFVVSDEGKASCIEARTGKIMWLEKIARHSSPSPVSAGGNLYFLDDDGVMTIIKPEPTFQVVAKNELGEACRSSPAIWAGRIYLRGVKNLYCIGQRE